MLSNYPGCQTIPHDQRKKGTTDHHSEFPDFLPMVRMKNCAFRETIVPNLPKSFPVLLFHIHLPHLPGLSFQWCLQIGWGTSGPQGVQQGQAHRGGHDLRPPVTIRAVTKVQGLRHGTWSGWFPLRYGGWKKSCTSSWMFYPIVYRGLSIQGAGFLPSTVVIDCDRPYYTTYTVR